MQTPTEPVHAARGDEDELYRRYDPALHRVVARRVRAPREVIDDACQTTWVILLRRQPERYMLFPWLCSVAIHEAYRLSASERRSARLEDIATESGDWQDLFVDPRRLDDEIEALEALRALASLPERQRDDLALKVGGHSYAEIRARTPGRTATNVNKSLVKAHRRIRQARLRPKATG